MKNTKKNTYRSKAFSTVYAHYLCDETLSDIKDELLDGMFFALGDEYSSKPHRVQLRLVRQLVERRQAKAVHKAVGHTGSRLGASLVNTAYRTTMRDIHRAQFYDSF